MKLINLTPHTVNLLKEENVTFDPKSRKYFLDDGAEPIIVESFEASGIVPRCRQEETEVGEVNGTKIVKMVFGEIENLPEQQEDTCYIVGAMIATAAPNRIDLLIPSHQVIRKNPDGTTAVIGCLVWGTAATEM